MPKPGVAPTRAAAHVPARVMSANEYIRRLDRLLLITSVITVVLTASFVAQML